MVATKTTDQHWTAYSRSRPCPHCGAKKRCQVGDDDGAEMCFGGPFMGSLGPYDSKLGTFYLKPGQGRTTGSVEAAAAPRQALSADSLHAAYFALLSHLGLSDQHKANLSTKGLSDECMLTMGLKSLERDRRHVAQRVAEAFPFWRDVPGLYEDESGRPMLAGSPGVLIPCYDLGGKITGLHIRKDDETGGKFSWFSSSHKLGGVGSGSHFSFYSGGQQNPNKVRICEGEIKSFIASVRTLTPTISAPGVDHFSDTRLIDWLFKLCCLTVVIAPDADFRKNKQVFAAVRKAIVCLQTAGFKVEVEVWDESRKGLDDALLANLEVKAVSPDEFLQLGTGFHKAEPLGLVGDPGPNLWTEPNRAKAPPPADWPTPDPFSVADEQHGQVGVPVWFLPEPLRHTVESIAGAKQVTAGTVVASLLGLLSAVCAGRYCAKLAPQYQSHSFIWILLSLRSSGGKSEALTVLSEAVFQAEKRLKVEAQNENDANASERANLRKQVALMEGGAAEDYPGQLAESRDRLKRVEIRQACRFIRHDVSPQKIGVLYAQYQRVSIVSAESADWISLIMGYGKDSGALLSSCLSGFSVEPYGEDRITREESHCNRPVLSLLLACQEDEVKTFLADPVARRRGFLGRTLIFQGHSLVGKRLAYDQRPDRMELACWNTLIRTVTQQTPESDEDGWLPISIPVEEEARKLFSRIFEVTEKRLGDDSPDLRLGEIEEITGRSMEQVGRLALLVHILWTASRGVKPSDEAITAGSVIRGFGLMLWALQGFLDLSGPKTQGSRQNLTLDLWQELRNSPLFSSGSCTVKEWLRLGSNRWRNSVKLEPQLAILKEMGYLDVINRKNQRGPVSRVIELNPIARDRDPETVATVATVSENPLFIEVIQAHPHLRRYCDGMHNSATVSAEPVGGELPGATGCDGIDPVLTGSSETVATQGAQVRAAGDLF
jgi:hypothetical protein